MYDADTTRHNALRRLHLHYIDAFAPIGNTDIQLITITSGYKNLLPKHIVDCHMAHTLCFNLKAMVSRIGEDVNGGPFLFRNIIR